MIHVPWIQCGPFTVDTQCSSCTGRCGPFTVDTQCSSCTVDTHVGSCTVGSQWACKQWRHSVVHVEWIHSVFMYRGYTVCSFLQRIHSVARIQWKHI